MNNPELEHLRSYDGVAGAYERVNAPLHFEAPARALVEFVAPPPGSRLLDAGTGTGAVARAAALAAGLVDPAPPEAGDDGRARGRALVAGVDPSIPMLEAARRRGVVDVVAGQFPDLPFVDRSFDVALSAFVMTHLDDADAAAREMRRVLRGGGRIGLSAWGPTDDDAARVWADVVHEFVEPSRLAQAVQQVLPGEDRFSRPGGLSELLTRADFASVRAETRRLTYALTAEEFVESKAVGASGRVLRSLLTARDWTRCLSRARHALAARFPGGVRYDRDVHLASGQRQP